MNASIARYMNATIARIVSEHRFEAGPCFACVLRGYCCSGVWKYNYNDTVCIVVQWSLKQPWYTQVLTYD